MRPGQKTANGTKLHYYEKTLAIKARKRFGGKTGMQLFFAEHMFQDKMEEGRHRVGRGEIWKLQRFSCKNIDS